MSSHTEELYGVSWSNPAWSHFLCSSNVLDYFCDLSNPFYDRQCNNEVIRMQRLNPEQLLNMTGVEFYLHHAQEPILFVIRKQQRLSTTQVTPLAYYYVIGGTVLQAPDLSALLNSRLLTTITGLKRLLQTLAPCARYHPSDGSYSWDDPNTLLGVTSEIDSDSHTRTFTKTSERKDKMKPANLFQFQRTDALLTDWLNRFPPPSSTFSQTSINPGHSILSGAASTSAPAFTPISTNLLSNSITNTVTAGVIKEESGVTHSNSPTKFVMKPFSLPGVNSVSTNLVSSQNSSTFHSKKHV